ncbi:protease modulator HflC [Magnetospirillum aberrantis]|uniref:Protein HflC n=1 Tax=Magnetospirillum aberrantis SpK TaxID=908842 RepID=A0A7C9QUQ1_9PROT|nr:protease modulator HflC [Magnetospirillum aberrantis]NFV81123.1 protease modulator HflC [Magnetospirillum aberrantis SpK]
MNRSALTVAAIAAAVVVVGAVSSLFVVNQAEQALVLRLGAHRATIKEPGLHFKVPLIEEVVRYEQRLLSLEPPAEEIILGDQKRIVVDTYTRYRISDPLKFYQTLRNETNARSQLTQVVSSALRQALGQVMLPSLLSEERTRIMSAILAEVTDRAASYGIAVADVRIRRADLPEETSQSIYDRMKSERERQAKELRAQGYEWGQQIRARADRERTVILAEATRQANVLRSEGDAESSRIYNEAYGRDPKFYDFYRSLEAYRTTLSDGNTTMVLSPDSEFFRHFGGANSGRR